MENKDYLYTFDNEYAHPRESRIKIIPWAVCLLISLCLWAVAGFGIYLILK